MNTLQWLDWLIFVGYLAGVFTFGLYMSRRQKTPEHFFLAGKQLPWYAIALSLFATNISSGSLIGLAGDGYRVGMAVGTLEWGALLGLLLLAFVFLPYYQRSGVFTTPEFLERRYNLTARLIFAGLIIVFEMFVFMPFVLYTGGLFLHVMFDLPIFASAVVIAVFVGVYTTFGGLGAVVWTDVVQGLAMLVGGTLVTILALVRVGGVGQLARQAPDHLHVCLPPDHPDYPFPATMIGGYLLITIYFFCQNQTIVQRTLGARSEWDGRMGAVGACFIKLFLPFVLILPGVLAFVLLPDLEHSDHALPALIAEVIPTGLQGLMAAAIVASLMSSADSGLNSWATIFTYDFYHRLIQRTASPQRLVLVGRLASVVLLVVAVCCTPLLEKNPSILQYILVALAYFSTPIIVVFLGGVLWRGATPAAAVTTLLTAPVICFAAQQLHKFITWWPAQTVYWMPLGAAMVASVMIIVSLFTRRKDARSLEGLIWTWKDTFTLEPQLTRRRGVPADTASARAATRPAVWHDLRLWGAVALLLMCAIIWWLR
ncbi:MAG: sodium transporter [Planctomycetaceae bacterium]|nr:sodium transporter [Planctomycetaceae bacterium]